MYNTILVPVDLAHCEKAAKMFTVVRKLANENAKVVLTSVIEDFPAYIAAELPSEVLVKSRQFAEQTLQDLAKDSGLDMRVEIRKGHPSTAILELADNVEADCIIVASHRPGFQDYLLGSTAARIVRHAECAVHVMR